MISQFKGQDFVIGAQQCLNYVELFCLGQIKVIAQKTSSNVKRETTP